jgi:hypothetical protein
VQSTGATSSERRNAKLEAQRKTAKKKKKLSACRGEGSAVGPLLAARALPLRCAASTVLTICTGYA